MYRDETKEQWQHSLLAGNRCFKQLDWTGAEQHYMAAYDLLEQNKLVNPSCRDTLFAWTATCHNLSTLFERSGELHLALHYLNTPHLYCQKMLAREQGNAVALIQTMNITWRALQKFSKDNANYVATHRESFPSYSAVEFPTAQLH